MNRFTDTDKWDKPWFMDLPPDFKHAWAYLNDKCDNAGVWDPNFRLANMQIGGKQEGYTIDWLKFRTEAGDDRIRVLANGKWWSTKFIAFQCKGPLRQFGKKGPNRPHLAIIALLKKHGLLTEYAQIEIELFGQTSLTDQSKSDPPPKRVEKPKPEEPNLFGEDMPPSKDQRAKRGELAKELIAHLNLKANRQFTASEHNLKLVIRVLSECADDVDGLKLMIDRQAQIWLGTEYEEYLQPSTLFAPTKWRERFEKRDLPVPQRNGKPVDVRAGDHEKGF